MSSSTRFVNGLFRSSSVSSFVAKRNFAATSFDEKKLNYYMNPRNVGMFNPTDPSVGTGIVAASPCGDVLKLQIKVDEKGKIIDAKFNMYGCGSSIACSSYSTEWLKGKTLEEVGKLNKTGISQELHLPPAQLHCSTLTEDSIQAALNDYQVKQQKRAAIEKE